MICPLTMSRPLIATCCYESTVILSVPYCLFACEGSDDLQTTDGQLHAVLEEHPVYDNVTDQWSLVLSCGQFTYPSPPPFNVEWLVSRCAALLSD
jgi:hypothetical protein